MKNINITMFDHYSSKRDDLLEEIQSNLLTNKESTRVRNLSNIMKNENNRYCLIGRNTNNIVGIMFYREAIYNYSYIINMIESNEGDVKPIGRCLFDKLYDIAAEEDAQYIYIETDYCPKLFYDQSSERDETCIITGLLLFPMEIVRGDKMENNMMFYLYKKNFFEYILTVKKDNNMIGTVKFYVNTLLGGYRNIEIESIDIESNDSYFIEEVLAILDNMATNNMIHKVILTQSDINYEHILTKFHYNKPKLPCGYSFEKLCNTQQYIDRTILSYYN
jgi:hypothetical protein